MAEDILRQLQQVHADMPFNAHICNETLIVHQKKTEDGIAGASSGTAKTIVTGGRTAHSVLKLPLNLAPEDSRICSFSKNNFRGRMLRQSKLLVRDEE
ncbi:hypothetical protein TNCV_1158971 [Trichonephila clavipes]|nr:hypothetical protein TNCV_1158971 [Trichonephila clavipes]